MQMYSGELTAPHGFVEIADMVGDDFVHRFSVSSTTVGIRIFADAWEHATRIYVVFPEVVSEVAE